MSPGGKRPGAGRPRVGREIKIAIRESDEARALAAGQTLAAYVRLGCDVLAAVDDGAGIAAVKRMIEEQRSGPARPGGRGE